MLCAADYLAEVVREVGDEVEGSRLQLRQELLFPGTAAQQRLSTRADHVLHLSEGVLMVYVIRCWLGVSIICKNTCVDVV